MCNSSGRLVAWMDGELAESEAAEIEQHVHACAECRECVSAYEDASREFAAYYAATAQPPQATTPLHKLQRWMPIAAATAAVAAVLLLALLPRAAKPAPPVPQVAIAATPSVQSVAPGVPLKPVAKRHATAHRKVPTTNWAMAEPAIQIAIPADAMFPPGAVPEGVTYVANLSLADGSVQGIRLQP